MRGRPGCSGRSLSRCSTTCDASLPRDRRRPRWLFSTDLELERAVRLPELDHREPRREEDGRGDEEPGEAQGDADLRHAEEERAAFVVRRVDQDVTLQPEA